MKSTFMTRIASAALFIILAIGSPLAAQNSRVHPQHHHYKLIDMGTFGGALSSINMATDLNDEAVSPRGLTVGFSATAALKLPTSHPIICGGDDGWGKKITHAFGGKSGGVLDLQAPPPAETNCSNAYQVNASGEIAGFSENGEFDPLTGTNQSRAVHWKNGKIHDLGS